MSSGVFEPGACIIAAAGLTVVGPGNIWRAFTSLPNAEPEHRTTAPAAVTPSAPLLHCKTEMMMSASPDAIMRQWFQEVWNERREDAMIA